MSLQSVHETVRLAEQNYLQGNTQLGKYVNWSMYETIETIDAYLNSKHTTGDTDSLGRPKPFFNIVTAAVNVWYRATDIDRKDIRFIPTKSSSVVLAFIANVMLQNWMNENRFGQFLNQWGRALSRYGSVVTKFVEQDGKLIPSVIPWNRYIADPVQFDALPRIEKFYLTPAQLRKHPLYDKDAVDALIAAKQERETIGGMSKDTMAEFIELYEVHGELDTRLLDKEPDMSVQDKDVKYTQQMHVIAYIAGEKIDEYEDFCLYKGREKKDPYMITHLIEEDGRTLSIGAVEYLFDAQWMQNHTAKNMKDTLDIASKLIFQTSDSSYVGRNVLNAIETGDIFIHKVNEPLTRVANDKPDITALQNFGMMWQNMGRELTSTPEATRGVTPPSGIALGTVQITTAQGLSLFEIMTENKGLSIEDMCKEQIIPNLKKKLKNKDEIAAVLDDAGITEIDTMYIPSAAIRRYNKRTLDEIEMAIDNPDAPLPTPFDPQAEQATMKQEIGQLGNKRFFKPSELDDKQWDEIFSDFEWDSITVEVTNENHDKQAVLTSLDNAFKTVASLAGRPMTNEERLIFSKIMQETGSVSPLQLSQSSATPPPMGASNPVPPTVDGGALPANQ
jgi:hypothetical protein